MVNKKKDINYKKSWAFVCCDRVGVEDKTTYVGCSNVIKINPV